MPLRTIATFAIAIVLGLIAVIVINLSIGSQKKTQVAETSTGPGSPVVVAAQPITRGGIVQPVQLKVVNYPSGSVPQGAFTSVNQLTGGKDVQRVALRDLSVDEPVLSTRVTGPGGKLNLATEIDPGMQAVTLRSSDVTGVGGFVMPNDRVDILMTRSVGNGGEKQLSVTQVIAENVRVLGIDQSNDPDQNKPDVVKAITIEVTAAQAQSITLAQTVGQVSLSLRHVEDAAPINRLVTTAASFGFMTAPAPAGHKVVVHHGPEVRVTRGSDTSVVELN